MTFLSGTMWDIVKNNKNGHMKEIRWIVKAIEASKWLLKNVYYDLYKLQLKFYIHDRSGATVLINASPFHLTCAYNKNSVLRARLYWIAQCNIIFTTYICRIIIRI